MPKKIPKEKTTDYKAAFEELHRYVTESWEGTRSTWGDRMEEKDYAVLDGKERAYQDVLDYMKYFKGKHTHEL